MTEPLLADATLLILAQTCDGEAFGKLTDPFRSELQVHCYRILGSAHVTRVDLARLHHGAAAPHAGTTGRPGAA